MRKYGNFFRYLIWVCLAITAIVPLIINTHLFFPFIVAKAVTFNIVVEVMFVAFLLLTLSDERYRLRINWLTVLMLIYVAALTLSSLLGNDFWRGFWSNNERCDGILLLIHLFLFVWVLTSFLRETKAWLRLFDLFFGVSALVSIVSLDQYLAITFPGSWSDHFLPSSTGSRLAATIGNPGYVAGYLIFFIFIGLFLFFKKPTRSWRIYYGITILVEIFLVLQTQTRGAIIALFLSGLAIALYLLFFYFSKKSFKIAGMVVIVVAALSVFGIFGFKDSGFIKSQPILNRIASISLSEVTASNRLVTWQAAWQGFKEKPILGWGQENFYEVFDKYYSTKNTELWFDRSHNVIFDRLVTGGVIGLIGYLAFLLAPFYFVWKYYLGRNEVADGQNKDRFKKYLLPVIFSLLIIAYFIQNVFIFEALVTYIPLMLVLSFIGMYSRDWEIAWLSNRQFKKIIAIIAVVLLLPVVWIFSLKPVYANADLIRLLSEKMTLEEQWALFDDIIGRQTMGNQEYRKQYYNVYSQTIKSYLMTNQRTEQNDQLVAQFSNKMELWLNDQIEENSHSVANYLLLMDFYNTAYLFNVSRLEKTAEVFPLAQKLSPGRPHIYYQVALSRYYLAYQQAFNKLDKEAQANYGRALASFYDGANLYEDKSMAFEQISGFLLSIKNDQYLWSWINNLSIGDMSGAEFLTTVGSWATTSDQKALWQTIVNPQSTSTSPIELGVGSIEAE